MHTEDLEAFFRIAESGSLTAAAEALSVPKSTISRRLARLEDELGAQLVLRTPRSTQITEVGLALYERASPALAHLSEVRRSIIDRSARPSGKIRVSAPRDMAAQHLGSLSAKFLADYPEVELEVLASNAAVDLVADGFDVALRIHLDAIPSATSLRMKRLCAIDDGIYASPAYLDSAGRPRKPESLDGHHCLSMVVGPRGWMLRHRKTDREVKTTVRPRLISDEHLLLRDAAIEGAGIALLPAFVGDPLVREGLLERVLSEWRMMSANLSALWPATHHTSPRVRAFLDVATAFFASPPWEVGRRVRR